MNKTKYASVSINMGFLDWDARQNSFVLKRNLLVVSIFFGSLSEPDLHRTSLLHLFNAQMKTVHYISR